VWGGGPQLQTLRARHASPLLLLLTILSVLPLAQAQPATPLPYDTHPIRTLDPADTDYSDLHPLGEAIGGARVVVLGEQTHGDGAALLAKTRVVQYLHAERGFDVLVMESGFYDCAKAWALTPDGRAARCWLPVWRDVVQTDALRRYLSATDGSLALAGMDNQLTGVARAHLIDDLRAQGIDAPERFWQALSGLMQPVPAQPSAEAQVQFYADLAAVQAQVPPESSWAQVLDGVAVLAGQWWGNADIDSYIRRDVQMAENLLWLLEHRYAGRKLIVWTGGYHAVRNLHTARTAPGTPLVYASHTTTADVLHAALGDDLYVINTTAAGGTFFDYETQTTRPVPAAESGTFEARLATHFTAAFANVQGAHTPMSGTPAYNYVPLAGDWSQLVDGVLFIREMTPSEIRRP